MAVEAALIDAYPGLSNRVSEHGGDSFGVRSLSEIEQEYRAEEADFAGRKILLTSIGAGWNSDEIGDPTPENILEQTRYSWVISPIRAEKADLVLAHVQGLIRGAFIANEWLPSESPRLSDHRRYRAEPVKPLRFGFIGRIADSIDWNRFLGKRVPDEYRQSSGQSVQYAGTLRRPRRNIAERT